MPTQIEEALAALDALIADALDTGALVPTLDPERPYALAMMPRVHLSSYDFGRVCVATADGTPVIDTLAALVTERAATAAGLQ